MAAAAVDDQALDEIAALFVKFMELEDLGEIKEYLAITMRYDSLNNIFLLSQERYILKLLTEYGMDSAFKVQTPALESDKDKWNKEETALLNPKAHKQYQALVGSLLYLMHATRPDIAFAVIRSSQFSPKLRECHWQGLKRIVRYLKGTAGACLVLGDVSKEKDAGLIGYFASAHADNINNRSTCAYIFLLCGSPISWASKVQRTVALSTTEAELMVGTEAAREAIWIKGLTDVLFDLRLDNDKKGKSVDGVLKCELRGDNQGSLALSVNPVFHQCTKHIAIRHRFISDMVNDGVVTVTYVPSADMLADGLTKPLPRDIHADHCARIGLRLHQDTPAINSTLHAAYVTSLVKKRKLRCDECGNLFADESALNKHTLKKAS